MLAAVRSSRLCELSCTPVCEKMDITPRKRPRIVILSQNTAMTMRNIAAAVEVGKYSVSRVINQQNKFGTVSPKRKNKCGRKLVEKSACGGGICYSKSLLNCCWELPYDSTLLSLHLRSVFLCLVRIISWELPIEQLY
ncbi:hypothetical protein CDAR_389521 [Caerostris darwini]|uniref:Uncharacterized protein n=1 Tax=Caerostris darwini TaxID=1538125 RepID=A0AAV4P0K6_9ARAC|nr:hypothetical protein CDAR_389521 [Caerostris darwini]